MDPADRALIAAVRTELAAVGDPERAAAMQAYMKSAQPFLGVPKPVRAATLRPVFRARPLADRDTWRATVRALWREAEFREERYAAIDLTGLRPYAAWQTAGELPLYEELVVTGAWWDFVDEVAIRRIGPLLRADRAALTPVLAAWATDADRWRRRTAVICQVTAKSEVDLALLTTAIEANVGDPDFFLRKAIGWALRDHARTAPEWVRAFVAAHPELSPLSRREAVKHL